jgi:hypothetical protein
MGEAGLNEKGKAWGLAARGDRAAQLKLLRQPNALSSARMLRS